MSTVTSIVADALIQVAAHLAPVVAVLGAFLTLAVALFGWKHVAALFGMDVEGIQRILDDLASVREYNRMQKDMQAFRPRYSDAVTDDFGVYSPGAEWPDHQPGAYPAIDEEAYLEKLESEGFDVWGASAYANTFRAHDLPFIDYHELSGNSDYVQDSFGSYYGDSLSGRINPFPEIDERLLDDVDLDELKEEGADSIQIPAASMSGYVFESEADGESYSREFSVLSYSAPPPFRDKDGVISGAFFPPIDFLEPIGHHDTERV